MTPVTPTTNEVPDPQIISYTALRNNLAQALEAMENGKAFCVTRRGHADLIITADSQTKDDESDRYGETGEDTAVSPRDNR